MFENIKGHKSQTELLARGLEKGNLAHAYVFAGPSGVGRKNIARELAAEMLEMGGRGIKGVKGERDGDGVFSREAGPRFAWHPDLLEIHGEGGIKIEQIRELIYKLSLKPYSAPNKVAIIDSSDQMTTEAANALLKVLEEPKSHTYIFLITNTPQRLPKTILSRCQKITFGPSETFTDESERHKQAEEFYRIFMASSMATRLILAYDMADLENPELKKVLDHWQQLLQLDLHASASKILAEKTAQVMQARKLLDQNVNTKLLLTNLMLNT